MTKREEQIRSNLDEAEAKREEAEKEMQAYQDRKEELERDKQDIIKEAHEDADHQKKAMLADAREAVETQKKQWMDIINRERENLMYDLRKRTGRQVFEITRKVLHDLTDTEVEHLVVKTFTDQIKNLSTVDKNEMLKAATDSQTNTLDIRSSFEMNQSDHKKIIQTLQNQIPEMKTVRFLVETDLVFGLEIRVGGWQLSWNLDHYLRSLENEVSMILDMEQQEKM